MAHATLAAAGASVVVGAALGGFFSGAPLGNDNSSHFAEILHIAELLRLGETDFWFDQTNLGYPLFLAYQPGPSLLMGALTALLRPWVEPLLLFKLSIVVVWALMPSAWYLGGRWLGMDRLSALVFGLLILSVSDFRTFGLGLTSVTSIGLYTQSYGTLLLPVSAGALYRYLFIKDVSLKLPTLLFSGTLLAHAYFGLYLAIVGGVMVIVRREGFLARARSFAAVMSLSGLLTAFWVIPFVLYIDYQGGLPWRGPGENGYPPAELARLALTGRLFDHARLPWMSLLVAVGLWLAWRHRAQDRERMTLLLLVVTVALLLGRTTWGSLYSWIPLHGELEVIRYLNGVHFCGLLLAGPAAAFLLERANAWVESLPGPEWLSPQRTTLAFLAAAFAGYLVSVSTTTSRHLGAVELTTLRLPGLVQEVSKDRSSRFLAHKKLDTASHFYLNLLPALSGRPQLESFARGYHDTLSLYYLEYFDFTAASFRLYNVGDLIARKNKRDQVPEFMQLTSSHGDLDLYHYPGPGGYFEFVRTPVALVGGLKEIRPVAAVLSPRLFSGGALPTIAEVAPLEEDALYVLPRTEVRWVVSGEPATEPKRIARMLRPLMDRYRSEPARSSVLEVRARPNEYTATVESAGSPERLLLKASYHPLWTAEVDGQAVSVDHVAPNLMAVDVPSGRHEVRFRYRNPAYQKLLFLSSLLAVILWWILDWRRKTRALARP
jgi:hypothetical protein